jgi:hypothetical protein
LWDWSEKFIRCGWRIAAADPKIPDRAWKIEAVANEGGPPRYPTWKRCGIASTLSLARRSRPQGHEASVSSRDEAVADDIEDIEIEGDIDAEERVRQAKLRPGDFNSTKQFLEPLARRFRGSICRASRRLYRGRYALSPLLYLLVFAGFIVHGGFPLSKSQLADGSVGYCH